MADRPEEPNSTPPEPDNTAPDESAVEEAEAAADAATSRAAEAIDAAVRATDEALRAEAEAEAAEYAAEHPASEKGPGVDDAQARASGKPFGDEPFNEAYRRAIKLDPETAEFLTHLYLKRRLNYQIDYYQKRIGEYDKNSYFLFRVSALVMTASSLLAALNTTVSSAELRLVIAILPAFAALVAGFRQLYNWERQAALYRDTIFSLEEARLVLPDLDQLTPHKALEVYPTLVKEAENAFSTEVSQWGQIARGKTKDGEDINRVKEFARQLNLDVFDDAGNVDQRKLGALAEIARAAEGGPTQAQAQAIRVDYPQIGEGDDVVDGAFDDDDGPTRTGGNG